jgi:hypothetical protein
MRKQRLRSGEASAKASLSAKSSFSCESKTKLLWALLSQVFVLLLSDITYFAGKTTQEKCSNDIFLRRRGIRLASVYFYSLSSLILRSLLWD